MKALVVLTMLLGACRQGAGERQAKAEQDPAQPQEECMPRLLRYTKTLKLSSCTGDCKAVEPTNVMSWPSRYYNQSGGNDAWKWEVSDGGCRVRMHSSIPGQDPKLGTYSIDMDEDFRFTPDGLSGRGHASHVMRFSGNRRLIDARFDITLVPEPETPPVPQPKKRRR
jgi:hypothetical protein